MKLKKGNVYYFEWRDHFTHENGDDEDCVIHSIGFFMKENNNYYYFSRSVLDDEDYHDTLAVIKSQMLSIEKLYRN